MLGPGQPCRFPGPVVPRVWGLRATTPEHHRLPTRGCAEQIRPAGAAGQPWAGLHPASPGVRSQCCEDRAQNLDGASSQASLVPVHGIQLLRKEHRLKIIGWLDVFLGCRLWLQVTHLPQHHTPRSQG